jgi:hypothetical protein
LGSFSVVSGAISDSKVLSNFVFCALGEIDFLVLCRIPWQ